MRFEYLFLIMVIVTQLIITSNCNKKPSNQIQNKPLLDSSIIGSRKVIQISANNTLSRRTFSTNIDTCYHTDLTLPMKPLSNLNTKQIDTIDALSKYLLKTRLKTIDGLMVDGNRDCEEVKIVIEKNLQLMRIALNQYLSGKGQKEGLSGMVGFRFVINGTGKIIDSRIIEATITNQEMMETFLNTLQQWQFEPLPSKIDTTVVAFAFRCCN